jgi:hypothetical protein
MVDITIKQQAQEHHIDWDTHKKLTNEPLARLLPQ